MTDRETCLDALGTLIVRGDPAELAAAQDILLRFILREDGAERRTAALDGLRAELACETRTGARSREQQAFHTVLLAMIERTRDMAGATTV
ncbi:hypothetical protein ACLBXO_22770 [Methylobacterium sp. C33D]